MPEAAPTTSERRGYFAVVVLVPLLGASLGVNGGPIFQILAIENLGLDPRQVGLAVGLGAISIPFQIMAARIPLRSAHRNLRVFIWSMAAMCLVMAWLIPGPVSASTVVVIVITIAVLAELAVSVLFATSFQPLLSTTIDAGFRQQLNAQGRAIGGLLAIVLVGLVSWAGATGRIVILVALAMLGAVLATAVSSLRRPAEDSPSVVVPGNSNGAEGQGLTWVYVAIGLSVVPAWPFVVTYASSTYWPSANLGAIGAALTVGSLGASAAWRPTADGLVMRARAGALVSLLCALALVPLNPSRVGWAHGAPVLLAIAFAAGAGTVVRLSLLEMAHLRSSSSSTVQALTRLDVVASTSLQLGFLAGGYLIDLSIDSNWLADPYQLSLIAGGVLLVGAMSQVKNGPVAEPSGTF
ncbi:MAG: hypothetical protein ACRBK7_13250 [Acidimicrobiales bacterium]